MPNDKSATISGFLVGTIWMPAAECYKPFRHDIGRHSARWSDASGATLRDHLLNITNDGDFRNCHIARGEITITRWLKGRRCSRTIPIERFKFSADIADMLHPEGQDWCEPCPEDWEEAA